MLDFHSGLPFRERAENYFFESYIQEASELYGALDTDFKVVALNQEFSRQFQAVYGKEIQRGSNLLDLIDHLPQEQKQVKRLWGRALAGEAYSITEDFGPDPHSRRSYEIKFRPVYDSIGTLIGAFQTVRDVTIEKRNQERLIRSELIFQSFFDSAPMMMGIVELVDNDIRHIKDNLKSTEFFGVPPKSTSGMLASEMGIPEPIIQRWRTFYIKSLKTKVPMRFNYWHKTGEESFHHSVTVSHIGQSEEGLPQFSYIIEDTTLQKRSMERILRDTFTKVAIGMAHLSQDGNFLMVNPKAQLISGYSEEELLEVNLLNLVLLDDRARLMEALSNLRSDRIQSESMEIRFLRKDGRIIWVRTQLTLGQRQESELKYFIISFEDISEAKWLEIEQARLYNLPNLILCVLDLQGHFKRVNSGFQTVLGYTMDELMGTDLFSLIHPEDLQRSMEAEKSGRTEDVHGFENRLRAKDGTYHWIRWTGRVVDGLNYGAGIEVTEQKVMEKELRESELRFRTFTEAMPQMAFISDEHGHISYYNKRHYEYFGLVPGDSERWTWKNVEIHHPDDRARTIDTLAYSLKTGEPYSIEYRLRRHDGQYRWHLGRAFPLRDVNGKIKAWLGTNTDIHDQKLHEAMLEETLRARDEFLSLASHELKTPITCLKLQFQMARRLRNQGGALAYDQDRINRLIDKSDEQVNRLVKLIEDMFDITRIRSGKLALSRELADLSELVIEVYERLSSHLKHIQVHLNFDKTLSYQANFDRSRMDQVITNLFTNAVKYGDGKPVEVAVRDCEEDNDFLLLSVKDQGRGIKPESLERIFDRFERDVNPNEVAGLGLGLYISRKIIEAHGGKIWCESEGLGKGSTFKVKVPKNHS